MRLGGECVVGVLCRGWHWWRPRGIAVAVCVEEHKCSFVRHSTSVQKARRLSARGISCRWTVFVFFNGLGMGLNASLVSCCMLYEWVTSGCHVLKKGAVYPSTASHQKRRDDGGLSMLTARPIGSYIPRWWRPLLFHIIVRAPGTGPVCPSRTAVRGCRRGAAVRAPEPRGDRIQRKPRRER